MGSHKEQVRRVHGVIHATILALGPPCLLSDAADLHLHDRTNELLSYPATPAPKLQILL